MDSNNVYTRKSVLGIEKVIHTNYKVNSRKVTFDFSEFKNNNNLHKLQCNQQVH